MHMSSMVGFGRSSRSLAVLVVASLPWLVTACPGDDGSASGSGTAESTSTGPAGTTGTSAADSGTAEVTSSSGTDGTGSSTVGSSDDTGSSSDTGTAECVTEPTEVLPAVLEVSVEILNDTDATAYVLGTSSDCMGYAVIRDGLPLPLQLGFICGCECPPPGPTTAEAVALEPGQTHVVTWDGRLLALYQEHLMCDQQCVISANGALQPLQPTPVVTMTIPIYTEAGSYPQPDGGTVQVRCDSPLSLSVDFEIGASDVTIPVALSEAVLR